MSDQSHSLIATMWMVASYNTARRHSTLGFLSPEQFETMTTTDKITN